MSHHFDTIDYFIWTISLSIMFGSIIAIAQAKFQAPQALLGELKNWGDER
ncbi:hypothetical protein GLOTRDRAFT_133442 [Gloeophyllum trabeum ATCC 11539]|uniref:Uncharacterized protein n=1 Tax=Gloeophyllum trabeum (strain ATCC 11539 / FP-39264 / Madison 617) TaxID=670483 RepID=S7RA36_GLOTA|nr:uncharacterized protein GLOTRDRAFT_133442 [Gloeophyllum trabeum ATCC 11539]EPQ51120.1 hypothetical protein GLOTRDRAFT_133442 [Gloeophyllum trabeum ATCC 11539]